MGLTVGDTAKFHTAVLESWKWWAFDQKRVRVLASLDVP